MTDVKDVYSLLITANASGANSVVKGFGAQTENTLTKTEQAAARVGQNAGTLFGKEFSQEAILGISALQATVGGLGLARFAENAVEETIKFARANAELAAQIATTGDVAGTSVDGINLLANSIEKSQAIYAGTVKQGAALLLTFQEIRNTQGAGNNIFDRTLTVSAAVANVFNKDIQAAVLQVGRALENPQAGMQALSRSGLTLAQQDRARILALAKQGDLLGAQKALLDALETRTLAAGAAAANADPLQRFNLDITKFKVAVGQDLVGPAKLGLASIEALQAAFEALPPPMRIATEALVATALVVGPLFKAFAAFGNIKAIKIAIEAQAAIAAREELYNQSVLAATALKEEEAASRGAAAALQAEAAAAAEAATSTGVMRGQLVGLSVGAADAISTSQRLQAEYVALGANGAAGLSAITDEFTAFDVGATKASVSAQVLGEDLRTVGVGGVAGLTQTTEQLGIFDETVARSTGVAGALTTELNQIGNTSGAGVAVAGEQLAVLDTRLAESALLASSLRAELAAIGEGAEPIARGAEAQLNVLDAQLEATTANVVELRAELASAGTGSGLGGVDSQLALLDARLTESAATVGALRTELGTLGTETGLGTIDAQLEALNARLVESAASTDVLRIGLVSVGEGGTVGLDVIRGRLAILEAQADRSLVSIIALDAALEATGANAPGLGQIDGQLSALDNNLNVTAAGFNNVGEQMTIFSGEIAAGGTTLFELQSAAKAAAEAVNLVTVAAAEAGGALTLFDESAATGGGSLGSLQSEMAATVAAAAELKAQLAGLDVGFAAAGALAHTSAGQLALFTVEVGAAGTSLEQLDVNLAILTTEEAAAAAAAAVLAEEEAVAATSIGLLAAVSSEASVGLSFLTASTAGLVASAGGLIGILGGAAAGFAAFTIAYTAFQHLGRNTPFSELEGQLPRVAKDIDDIQHKGAGFKLFHFPTIKEDQNDIHNINAELKQTAETKGPQAAREEFERISAQLEALGVSGADVSAVLRPAVDTINNLQSAANNADGPIKNLSDDLNGLLSGGIDIREGYNAVADAFDTVSAAAKKVADDYANLAGTGDEAVAAAKAVADAQAGVTDAINGIGDAQRKVSDAYNKLTDSQDEVTTSTHKLQEAQQALDLYNSARGATERALAADILNRRVATTPAEEDQKRLDILKFQDDNANKQQSLQDAVTSAAKSQRDAIQSVADAEQGITDALAGRVEAIGKVATAEDALTTAQKKQKQESTDAAAALATDKRKLQEAGDAALTKIIELTQKTDVSNQQIQIWSDKLKGALDQYAPGSAGDKNIDRFFTKLLGYQKASNALADQSLGSQSGRKGRGDTQFDPNNPSDRAAARDLGIPGFADGGIVPGPRGAPQLIIAHGGERVQTEVQQRNGSGVVINQNNNYYGDASNVDANASNKQLAWSVARLGRGS